MHNFHIIWTLSMLLMFLAIIVWAFSRRRKSDFEQASHLPLEDDESEIIPPPPPGLERQ